MTISLALIKSHSAKLFATIGLAVLAATQTAMAAPVLSRPTSQTIDLSGIAFQNKTYLQTTLQMGDGIYDKTIADDSVAQKIASASQLTGDFTQYDSKEQSKVCGTLTGEATTFTAVVNSITGTDIKPMEMPNSLTPYITAANVQSWTTPENARVVVGDIILIGSGAGTLVQLTPDDYFYNVSYQAPSTKTGRTYAVSGSRKLLDPSDTYYLNEIGDYIGSASATEQTPFFTAFLKVLTASDTSEISSVSATGQTVLTDLIAIYTAESMRHNMVELNVTNSAWEIDIAEVTLLSPYIVASGMVMSNGNLVAGGMTTYTANGHSIGVYEPDYEKLAKLITKFENQKKKHPDLVKALKDVTPLTPKSIASKVKGDTFRQALVYLNRKEFESGAQSHASEITSAMLALVNQIRVDQADITTYVKAHE